MINNMNVEGILRHIEVKSEYNKSIKKNKDTNIVKKIKPYNFFTRNEIKINNSLHLLEHKTNRYITIKNATKLSINEVNDDIIKKTEIGKGNEYILLKYEVLSYISNSHIPHSPHQSRLPQLSQPKPNCCPSHCTPKSIDRRNDSQWFRS